VSASAKIKYGKSYNHSLNVRCDFYVFIFKQILSLNK
jgi:hypothetical protein